ncbi:hypothetical protein [Gelidibacter gilvus]|uniref:Lipocalin-like domain-containing protein n=1 Tax=Gelidibacter gilvus TaxID=59602 RepID=A0A4Q0XJ75_9FLAO|nr:hypothetical protein [Gelidibacter gilvus]RXJ50055.1 hypothetical protein ESZ48_08675 [Gelidibacter gilvus]
MKKLVLLSAVVFGLVFYSCSSDDDNGTEETVSLVGDWQLTNVDFTSINEEGRQIPASDPCIVEIVAGYRFFADKSFFFILGEAGSSFPTKGDYWSWEGDTDDFKITQKNLAMPPYNFGLTPEQLVVKEVNGKTQMTFTSVMGNGSTAKFKLVKEEIDPNKLPKLTAPDDPDFYCGFFDPK